MYQENYDDVNFCLDLLFNFVYENNNFYSSICYELDKHFLDMEIIDIKNLKKYDGYYKKFLSTFKNKFDYLDQVNITNDVNSKLIFTNSNKFLLKVSKYSNQNKNLNDLNRSELIDMKISFLLSTLSIRDYFNFILLPIFNFDVPYNLDKVLLPQYIQDNLSVLNLNDEDTLCFQMYENFYETYLLSSYLEQNYKKFNSIDWKILCFQVLYALFKIQKKYPSFRHNSLTINTIWITIKEKNSFNFKINEFDVVLPNMNFEIKLSNFNQSFIRDIANNKNSRLRKENEYYDVFNFCNSLLKFIYEKNIDDFYLKKFLDEIVPEKYRNKNYIELDEDFYQQNVVTILNPYLIITKNNFFSDFIKQENMYSKKREIQNNDDLTSSLTETDFETKPRTLARMHDKKNNQNRYNNSKQKKKSFNELGLYETDKENSDSEYDSDSYNDNFRKNKNNRLNNRKMNYSDESSDSFENYNSKGKTYGRSQNRNNKESNYESEDENLSENVDDDDIQEYEDTVDKRNYVSRPLENNFEGESDIEEFEITDDSPEEKKSNKRKRNNSKGRKNSRISSDEDLSMDSDTFSNEERNSRGAHNFMRAFTKDKEINRMKGSMPTKNTNLMEKLPGNYEGILPDWLQNMLPNGQTPPNQMPQMSQMPQMPQMSQMPQMPQFSQYNIPDQINQIPNQLQNMPEQINQQFSQIPNQLQNINMPPQFQQISTELQHIPNDIQQNVNQLQGMSQFNPMANGIMNTPTPNTAMVQNPNTMFMPIEQNNQFNNKADVFNQLSSKYNMPPMTEANQDMPDHASLLPKNMIMNQMGGKKSDNFFFLREEEEK